MTKAPIKTSQSLESLPRDKHVFVALSRRCVDGKQCVGERKIYDEGALLAAGYTYACPLARRKRKDERGMNHPSFWMM